MKMKKTIIKSDVAGVVNEICFSKGDIVKKGESLLFIESMKMEIPIEAPFDSEIDITEKYINEGLAIENC